MGGHASERARISRHVHVRCIAGLAAGFDKGAEAVEGLLGLGLGFLEIGVPLSEQRAPFECVLDIKWNSAWGQGCPEPQLEAYFEL